MHLLRHAPAGTHVNLIERNRTLGPGLAYSTNNPSHRLNVPAGKMSASEDAPKHFLDWLQCQPAQVLSGVKLDESRFVPRGLYGAYLQHLLDAIPQRFGNSLKLVHDNVEAAINIGDKVQLSLGSGEAITADVAVLATGNARPEPPPLEQPGLLCVAVLASGSLVRQCVHRSRSCCGGTADRHWVDHCGRGDLAAGSRPYGPDPRSFAARLCCRAVMLPLPRQHAFHRTRCRPTFARCCVCCGANSHGRSLPETTGDR